MSPVTKDARLEFLEKEWQKNRGKDLVSVTYIEENYASAGKGIINYDAAKEVMHFDRNFLITNWERATSRTFTSSMQWTTQ